MEKTNKKSIIYALVAVLGLLLAVSILENLCLWIPAASLPKWLKPTSMLFTVLKKGAVYSLIAVSLNLLNGFTGLFSLGHAGFMLLGAYTYAIFCTDTSVKESIFYKYGGSSVNFSFVELFESFLGENMLSTSLGVIAAMLMAGLVAALFAFLIGLPVLRLKSDYLAIATLGFAEIVRALFSWDAPLWGKITNGANMIKGFPKFTDFNIKNANGQVVYYMSTLVPFIVAGVCIAVMVLIIRSTHGRAFKAIRDDEIAAEAMGINLAKHKMLSFCTSAFFAGVGGVMYAMYTTTVQAKPFTSALTYEILLIVVIGGIGSVSGSCLASFLFIACSEWWLRFLDKETMIGSFRVPLLRDGFRMVVFSVVIMIIVLFFRRGMMGDKELPEVARNVGKKLSALPGAVRNVVKKLSARKNEEKGGAIDE